MIRDIIMATMSNQSQQPVVESTYLAVGHGSSPYLTIYKRSGDTFTKLANPSTLPTGYVAGLAWSSDDQYLAVGHNTSPYLTIYKRSGDTFTKLANPSTLPTSNGSRLAWSPDNQYLAVGHDASLYLTIYKRSGDTFTKLANPSTLPSSYTKGVSWSPDGQYLLVNYQGGIGYILYNRSGDTFTSVSSDPLGLPSSTVSYNSNWSKTGNLLAIAHNDGNNKIKILKRNGSTFTSLYDLTSVGSSYGIDFTDDGKYLAYVLSTAPYLKVNTMINDVLTTLTTPPTPPNNQPWDISWSSTGTYFAVTHLSANNPHVYKQNGDDTFTKLTLSALVNSIAYAVAFSSA